MDKQDLIKLKTFCKAQDMAAYRTGKTLCHLCIQQKISVLSTQRTQETKHLEKQEPNFKKWVIELSRQFSEK